LVNRKEIESKEDLGNRNALGFHIPKMWDKILDIKNVTYKKILQMLLEMKSELLQTNII
jgi:hypothetical protein